MRLQDLGREQLPHLGVGELMMGVWLPSAPRAMGKPFLSKNLDLKLKLIKPSSGLNCDSSDRLLGSSNPSAMALDGPRKTPRIFLESSTLKVPLDRRSMMVQLTRRYATESHPFCCYYYSPLLPSTSSLTTTVATAHPAVYVQILL